MRIRPQNLHGHETAADPAVAAQVLRRIWFAPIRGLRNRREGCVPAQPLGPNIGDSSRKAHKVPEAALARTGLLGTHEPTSSGAQDRENC